MTVVVALTILAFIQGLGLTVLITALAYEYLRSSNGKHRQ